MGGEQTRSQGSPCRRSERGVACRPESRVAQQQHTGSGRPSQLDAVGQTQYTPYRGIYMYTSHAMLTCTSTCPLLLLGFTECASHFGDTYFLFIYVHLCMHEDTCTSNGKNHTHVVDVNAYLHVHVCK